jgi:hypothetical protein
MCVHADTYIMHVDERHISRLPYTDLTEYAEEITGDKPTTSNEQTEQKHN